MRNLSDMQTVDEFIKTIGRADFTEETGFSPQVISRAIVENIMPPGWFVAVRDLCASRGIETPEWLFRWADKRKAQAAE